MRSRASGKLVLYTLINATVITTVNAYAIIQGSEKSYNKMESTPFIDSNSDITVSFSHFHMYVDEVDDLTKYKSLESKLNVYDASLTAKAVPLDVEEKKKLWRSLGSNDGTADRDNDVLSFTPQNRDVVRQLIAGLGFRVTGYADNASTRTVLVSSRDPDGVQILVSAMKSISGRVDNSVPTSRSTKYLCDFGEFVVRLDLRIRPYISNELFPRDSFRQTKTIHGITSRTARHWGACL